MHVRMHVHVRSCLQPFVPSRCPAPLPPALPAPLLAMFSTAPARLAAALLVWTSAPGAEAWDSYVAYIPNGDKVMRNGEAWAGVGHAVAAGGGERNQFGADFGLADRTWTVDFCQQDSDGDGQSNGMELGDPECLWKDDGSAGPPSRTTDISHPGFADSTSAAGPAGGGAGGGGDSGEIDKDAARRPTVAIIGAAAAIAAAARAP